MKNQERRRQKTVMRKEAIPFLFGTAVALTFGLIRALQLRWVCDDAFITFRYIENFLGGEGLVFNVGERVEGYTHFLWLMLVALFRWLGLEPVAITQVLGLLAYVGTLILFAQASRKLSRSDQVAIPITSLLLAVHFDFSVWATGGLETSLFTFLISASFYTVAVADLPSPKRSIFGGLLLALSVLTRPDGILFLLVAGLYLVLREASPEGDRRRAMQAALLFTLPVLGLLLPWLAFKSLYYGSILPNTYYAKSAGTPYYEQGFYYIGIYTAAYLSTALVLLGAIGRILRPRVRGDGDRQRFGGSDSETPALLLCLAFVITYTLGFIARVGGDFMYARFLHPLIPLVYFSGEIGLRRLFGRTRPLLFAIVVLLMLLVAHERSRRDSIFLEEDGSRKGSYDLRGVTDEHWYWGHRDGGLTLIEKHEAIGRTLARYFEGEAVRVLLRGQASLGYYGRFSFCIESAGLTDRYIAHQPREERGRPGHEKSPPHDYLVRMGVHFLFLKAPIDSAIYRNVYFRYGDRIVRGEMFTYDRDLMHRLGKRWPDQVRFIDFEAYLDQWILQIETMSDQDVAEAYERFRDFYFLHNPDPLREEAITSFLRRNR